MTREAAESPPVHRSTGPPVHPSTALAVPRRAYDDHLMRHLPASLALALVAGSAAAQTAVVSGTRPARLIIRNATIVDGNGTPAKGPFDIVVQGGTITQLVALDPVALGRNGADRRPRADVNTAE